MTPARPTPGRSVARSRMHWNGPRTAFVVAGVAAVALSLAACGTGSGKSGGSSQSFYKGKTITYIVPQPPGGSYDASLQPVLPIVEKELGAKINPVYIKQGTSIVGQDRIATARPDGLTIGTMSVSADLAVLLEGQQLLNFDLTKQSLIAGNLAAPLTIVACKGSPFKTIQQVINSKTPFKVINTGQGPGFELVKVLFNAYDAPVQSLSGYEDSASQTAGCLRGDAPLALQTIAALTPDDFKQGLVHSLVVTTAQPKSSAYYQYLKDTPTLAQLFASDPPTNSTGKKVLDLVGVQYGTEGLGIIVAGPPGIPADRLKLLRDAFRVAYTTPSVAAAMTKAGLVPGYVSPSQAIPFMQQLIKSKPIIEPFINK